MPINFPDSPSIGDTYTSNGRTWQWDGSVWAAYGNYPDPTVLKVDTANDRVGINNTSPTAALDVTGAVKISSNLTVDTSTLHVDATNNRVGIGTTSPERTLHVDAGTSGGIVVQSSEDSGVLLRTTSGSAKSWQISQYYTTWNDMAAPLILQPIQGSGTMDVSITPVTNSPASGINIKADGKIGIGVAGPRYPVEIQNSSSGGLGAHLVLRNPNNVVSTSSAVSFEVDTSTELTPNGRIEVRNVTGASGQSIMLFHIWNGSSFVETMKISNSYSGAGGSATSGVSFANAAFAIDRGWSNYPSLTVFNSPSPYTELRIHGANTNYGSYPGASGADFSVNVYVDGTVSWISDARAKTNIVDNPYGLEHIRLLQPRKFDRINSEGAVEQHATNVLGFIAQEVIQVIPEAVVYHEDEDEPNEIGWCKSYAMQESYIVSTLVNAVKELADKNDALEARLAALEAS